jgi:hypothetical protein
MTEIAHETHQICVLPYAPGKFDLFDVFSHDLCRVCNFCPLTKKIYFRKKKV